MGCPGAHLLSIYARFSGKKGTLMYISRERGDHDNLLHANTAQRSVFTDYNLFLGKLKAKLARKARVNTERVYRIVLMPPWASHNTP